jgi:hypothetical protein
MGFDLHLAPAERFLEWDDRQWNAYWNSDLPAESEKLGNSTFVALTHEAIIHNLEGDRPGSKFPVLMRIDDGESEHVGWHADEIPAVLAQVQEVARALASMPVNRATLMYDNDDVPRRVEEFQHDEGRAPENIYDLCRHYFETFELMTRRAMETGHGLVVSF